MDVEPGEPQAPPSPRLAGIIERAIADIAYVEMLGLPTEQLVESRAREVAVQVIMERCGIAPPVLDAAVSSAAEQLRMMAAEVVAEGRLS